MRKILLAGGGIMFEIAAPFILPNEMWVGICFAGIGALLILWGIVLWIREKWPQTWLTLIPLAKRTTQDSYLLMSDVARIAYERSRTEENYYLVAVDFHDGYGNNSNVLNDISMSVALSGIDLFGKHPPSTVFEKIPQNVENNFEFRNNGISLHPMGNDNPQYVDVSIKQSDLDVAINRINQYEEQ